MDTPVGLLNKVIVWINQLAPADTFFAYDWNVRAFLAVILVSLVCGAIGSLVVGNRMAFFSDALAHCAFAGVALGLLIAMALRIAAHDFREWLLLIMVGFGIGVGVLIALVREKTGLANDTVIGVFFAGAIGVGAIFMRMASRQQFFNIESFIFGDPQGVKTPELFFLFGLIVATLIFLARCYNDAVLSSVHPSLALSRNVPVRLNRYLLVILLGIIVNVCLHVVGTLLINALLIVPAATAANYCRNLRQLFWHSVGLCLVCGLGGLIASWELTMRFDVQVGGGGAIVVLAVLLFSISMFLGPWMRGRQAA